MNIIDFHTHVFPDAIAQKTISALAEKAQCTPYGNGTLTSLLDSVHKNQITYSVSLPVVTRPQQFDSILRFAIECNQHPEIIAFAGMHPDDTEPDKHLLQIKEAGLKGIKLHPDYQQTMIDDPKYIRIIQRCIELNLLVLFHAGFDGGFPEKTHCTPNGVLRMLQAVYGETIPEQKHIILAHGGANRMFDEVETLLCGMPVYFDLSYILSDIESDQLMRIIRKHGVENIFFATDFPWSDPARDIAYLNALPLTEAEKECIFWRNAKSALHMTQS